MKITFSREQRPTTRVEVERKVRTRRTLEEVLREQMLKATSPTIEVLINLGEKKPKKKKENKVKFSFTF